MLAAEPSADVQLLAVWLSPLGTDSRDTVDATLLDDPRVAQYWDGRGVVGRSFAETDVGGLGLTGFVYDAYYVFGPDARWGDDPAVAGSPVLPDAKRLLAAIRAPL